MDERKLPTSFLSVAHHKTLNLAACFQRGSGVSPQVSWAAPSSHQWKWNLVLISFCPAQPWLSAPPRALLWQSAAPRHRTVVRNISIHFQTSSFRLSPHFVFQNRALSQWDHFCFMRKKTQGAASWVRQSFSAHTAVRQECVTICPLPAAGELWAQGNPPRTQLGSVSWAFCAFLFSLYFVPECWNHLLYLEGISFSKITIF